MKREDEKKKRVAAGNETLVGYGRYMGADVLKERADWGAQKHFDETWNALGKVGIDLIGQLKVKKAPLKLSGRGNAKAFATSWKEFKTTPEFDIFKIEITTSWILDTAVIVLTAIATGSSQPATRKPSAKPSAKPAAKPATTRVGRTVKVTTPFDYN